MSTIMFSKEIEFGCTTATVEVDYLDHGGIDLTISTSAIAISVGLTADEAEQVAATLLEAAKVAR